MSSKREILEQEGFLAILSAPSGAGKTTIYKEILNKCDIIEYSISVTTRPKRDHETDGVDYIFMDEKRFQKLVDQGAFAEWAVVHGNMYGTLRKTIDEAMKARKILIFDIDVQGAMQLKEIYGEKAILIFIITPSYEILKRRLYKRHTDCEETIQLRLKNALWEFDHIDKYDYIVINDELDEAIQDVEGIIHSESLRLSNITNVNWKGL